MNPPQQKMELRAAQEEGPGRAGKTKLRGLL